LLDSAGNVLATHHFTPRLIEDGNSLTGFSFFVPAIEGVEGLRIYAGDQLLFEQTVSGAAPVIEHQSSETLPLGGVTITWNLKEGSPQTTYRVRFSPNGGQNWQVLAIETQANSFTLWSGLLQDASEPLVEIQAVDGLRTATEVIPIPLD